MRGRSLLWRLANAPSRLRIRFYLVLFAAQIIIYTVLYHTFYPQWEGRPLTWFDALLFVLETVTTTGYGEQLPFRNEATVVFAIVVMLTGVVMIFMFIPLLLAPYLTTIIRAAPPRRTPYPLDGHVVIVGYSELVRSLVDSLMIADLDIVVVVEDEAVARDLDSRYRPEVYVVWGAYAEPSTWRQVSIENASTVIVTERERTTASVILGIRDMTAARIIAIVDDLAFDRYLRYAGAEYVLSPKNSTGRILARHAVLRPVVETIYEAIRLEGTDIYGTGTDRSLQLVKVPIMSGSPAAGKSLRELALVETYGVEVLFFWKGGRFVPIPKADDVIDTSTMLFVLGPAAAISEMIDREFAHDGGRDSLAVVAGFGDVGRAAYRELASSGIASIVVDQKPYDVTEVVGNVEDEGVLRAARIEGARFCVVAVNDDDVNIFTTLMARNLNPSLRILARANEPSSVDKLYRAGADYVTLLPAIGGQVIAGIILSEIAGILLDLPDGQKVVMKHRMRDTSTTVGAVEVHSGVRIVGIEGAGRSVIRPQSEDLILPDDTVIAFGRNETLKRFIRLM
ncbi:hypothetical protein ABH15_03190 [Methanoculleus taiwanensis]|uniref:Potassium transporter TrkA n=1 Tax=Methanoculleus taiwanensis TaxID=1550565 RepID=A0A498H5F8_9EURY|nr:NAD-binding protein [Methanoculleus taiwanensis]RXE57140.1 hypothetical protein ABH15_03190 [Methanoculleus taiwanensis]